MDLDADGIADDFEEAMARRFAPELRFHFDERHLPSSVPWYLDKVDVWFFGACGQRWVAARPSETRLLDYEEEEGTVWVDEYGQVHCLDATVGGRRHRSGFSWDAANGRPRLSGFFMRIRSEVEAVARAGDIAGTQVYVHVRPSPAHHAGRFDLTYWFFYPYNPDVCAGFGNHEGDWERVTVRVEPDGETLHKMGFASHGSLRWYEPAGLRFNELGRPIVYVAKGSHASYPQPGEHDSSGCNDHADPFDDLNGNGVQDAFEPTGHVLDTSDRLERTGEWHAPARLFLEYSGYWGSNFTDIGLIGDWTGINEIGSPTTPFYKGSWLADDLVPKASDHPDQHAFVFAVDGSSGGSNGRYDAPLEDFHDADIAGMTASRCQPMWVGGAWKCGIEILLAPGRYLGLAADGVSPGVYAGPSILRSTGDSVVIGEP